MNDKRKISALIGADSLSIEQLRKFPRVIKAKGTTKVEVKTVHKKGKTFQQKFHVKAGQEVKKDDLSLKTLSDETIAKFKKNPSALFFKMVRPISASLYKKTGLRSVGIEFDDADSEANMVAYKSLMAYKGGKQKIANLSTMIYGNIYRKYQNLYKTARNQRNRVQVDRYDSVQNIASVVDNDTKADMNNAVQDVKRGIADRAKQTGPAAINNQEYQDMFQEWLDGLSFRDMAEKRGVSRVMISGKFKRIIYPIIKDKGYEKGDLSKIVKEKQKFIKKAKSSGIGYAILLQRMSDMLGEGEDLGVNSFIAGQKARKKTEAMKKFAQRISKRRDEKLWYRYIRNFDFFTYAFMDFVNKQTAKDSNNRSSTGFAIDGESIIIYDRSNMAVMQTNLLLALIYKYISENYEIEADPDKIAEFTNKFRKQFRYEMPDMSAGYAAFHTLLKAIGKMGHRDDATEQIRAVEGAPDSTLEYVYDTILEVE